MCNPLKGHCPAHPTPPTMGRFVRYLNRTYRLLPTRIAAILTPLLPGTSIPGTRRGNFVTTGEYREETMRQTVRLLAAVALGASVAFALAAPAQAQQTFTLGYSTGFLQDPFQVIQADRVMAEGKKAGLKTLPVANASERRRQADHRLPQPDRRGRAGHPAGCARTATRSCRR